MVKKAPENGETLRAAFSGFAGDERLPHFFALVRDDDVFVEGLERVVKSGT